MEDEKPAKYPPLLTLEQGEEVSDDIRKSLKSIRVGHNLTSVLNSPTPTSSGATVEYTLNVEALQNLTQQFFETINDNDSRPAQKIIPSVIPPVSLHDFHFYLEKHESELRAFVQSQYSYESEDLVRKERVPDFNCEYQTSNWEVNSSSHSRQRDLVNKEKRAEELLLVNGHRGEGVNLSNALLNFCFKAVPTEYFMPAFKVYIDEEVDSQIVTLQLQQRLTTYLDIVEVCLWKQTTSQAESFFNTLYDLRILALQVSEACSNIARLRNHIKHVRVELAARQLHVLQLKRRKENIEKLIETSNRVKHIRSTLPTVDSLLAVSHDYGGALALIQEAKSVLSKELYKINSLKALARQLNDYEEMIAEKLTHRFIELCVSWEIADNEFTDKGSESTQNRLTMFKPIIIGLLRVEKKQMHQVLEQYRKRILEEVTICAKDSVTESLSALRDENITDINESTDDFKSSTNTEQLISLSAEEFLSFLNLVFYNLEMVMTRSNQVHINLTNILDEINNDMEFILETSRVLKLREESEEIVCVVCTLVEQSIKQLLQVRAEVHERLRMVEFQELWNTVIEFCNKGEQLSKSKWFDLRGAILVQAKSLLDVMHEKQKSSLYNVLDGEEWKQTAVPFEIQAVVYRLVRGQLGADRAFSKASAENSIKIKRTTKSTSKELIVNGKPYRVVPSVLMLISYLERYLSCAERFPNLSSSVLSRIIDILRLFNERTNNLVLQAEACKTAGLKRINTKNLGLACQSLTVVLKILPTITKMIGRTLASKFHSHMNSEIERIDKEYQMHQKCIYCKFHDMIDHLLEQCCGILMKEVKWDAKTTEGLGKPQEYMTKLAHGVTSMYNVLFKIMSPEQMEQIFKPIFELFNTKIPEYYANVDPITPTGRSRARVDIKHLLSTLRRLRGLSGPGEKLEVFLADKFGGQGLSALPSPTASQDTQELSFSQDLEDEEQRAVKPEIYVESLEDVPTGGINSANQDVKNEG